MRAWSLLVVLATGCGLAITGAADLDGGALPIADASAPVEDTGPGVIDDASVPVPDAAREDAAPPDAGGDAAPPCIASACDGKVCTAGACSYAPDCATLRRVDNAYGSGIFNLRRGSTSFRAYCEMALAGGGWTLIARSAGTQDRDDFGWGEDTGSVDDRTQPYSIDALARGLPINDVLIVAGSAQQAYVIKPPVGFPNDFGEEGGQVQSRTYIQNAQCSIAAAPAPSMFGWMGHTDRKDLFFFRDMNGFAGGNFGLHAMGWRLNYDNCTNAGEFDDEQGMIFVR